VQIVGYELRKQMLEGALMERHEEDGSRAPVSIDQIQQLYAHLQQCLLDIGYYDPRRPRRLMRRLKRLINRAQLDENEYNIVRGILAAVQETAAKSSKE